MIEVYCIRGLGNKEMGEIDDTLLTSVSDAVQRGKYEIEKQWYYVHSQSLSVPFKKANGVSQIMDGDIVFVSDSFLGISENKKVKSVVISGNTSDVEMSIETESYEDSE